MTGASVGVPPTIAEAVVTSRSVTTTSGLIWRVELGIDFSSSVAMGMPARSGDRKSRATRIVALLAVFVVLYRFLEVS